METDTLRRFLLERPKVRGVWLHLDQAWRELLARTDYPPAVREVLGEAMTATVLLAATIKHEGSLILQIRGTGPIHLLVVQATADGKVRGLARWQHEPPATDLVGLFGNDAHLVVTAENHISHERYQSLIPLAGESLSQAIESYFANSEQLPTRLWLTANAHNTAGILLQRLPQASPDMEDWQRTNLLLDTLTAEELNGLDAHSTLFRLFHEEDICLFDGKPIQFHCGCSRERVETMLQALGQAEAEATLHEQGQIEVTCEFCNAKYTLDAIDVAKLFQPTIPSTTTLH